MNTISSSVKRIDFVLVLAVITETPRWVFAFMAINEPWWVGVPVGALLAYATSEGWKTLFSTPARSAKWWLLFALNTFGLAAAVFVISPVLFAMTAGTIETVQLANVLPGAWLMAWAVVLAATTFLPLMQLAAARSGATQPAPVHKPVASAATVQADADADAEPQPRIAPTNGNKARIAKARAIEMICAEQLHLQESATRIIADRFGVNPSTASRWIKAINQEVAA